MSLSRATLPVDFFDLASKAMLVQPEPAYVYARLLFAAVAQAELRKAGVGMVGISPERSASSAGGAPAPDLADLQQLLSDPIRAEALTVNMELAGTGVNGQTVRINRPVFSGGGYAEASRIVNPAQDISVVPLDVSSEQASLTLRTVAGPYDSANSRVAPYGINALDAKRAVHELADIIGLHMSRDRMKYVDTVLATLFSAGNSTVFPGDPANALSGVDTAFIAAGDRPMDVETIFRAEEKLETADIPRFANGRYMAVLNPRQIRQLRSDPEFQDLAQNDQSRNPLQQAFVATIGNSDIYSGTTNLSTTNSGAITYYKGTMFGPGAVGYAPGEALRVIASTSDNYGLLPKVIWACVEAFEKLDNRMICGIYTD